MVLGVALAGASSGLCLLLADQYMRPGWDFSWLDHWSGAPILYLGPAALLGLLWSQVSFLNRFVTQKWIKKPKIRHWVRAMVVAALGGLLSIPTAFRTFSGPAIARTWLGSSGPWIFLGLFFLCIMGITFELGRAQRSVDHGRMRRGLATYLALMAGAVLLVWVDMNVYVGLYRYLHHFLEYCAFALFFAAFQLLGYLLVGRYQKVIYLSRVAGSGLILLGASYVSLPSLRVWVDAQLSHAWVDEFYVGRALRRVTQLELLVRGEEHLAMERVRFLKRRFDIADSSLSAEYLQPTRVPPTIAGEPLPLNVVVFYVDTLRADVAYDDSLMPHFAEFRAQSLDFSRAYASGSDTLRSLPGILRGNYFLDGSHPGSLLRLAKSKGIDSRLVISFSAQDFLGSLLPGFKFDESDIIVDVEQGEEAWGYGAHRPTAADVVNNGIEFIQRRTSKKPFLLWLFHFDQHGWREIDEDFVQERARTLQVPEEGRLNFRYRVLARTIDEEFGRFMRFLNQTERAKDTVVLFLSDHGEGLGRHGFWVHSIFLWENLIRVPLAIKIPGQSPHRHETAVSLLDVAPTIASLWGGAQGIYHGQDLRALMRGAPRQFPILLRGGPFDGLDRIGLVDHETLEKFVLRIEAGFTELYDLKSDPRENDNLARSQPRRVRERLRELAKTPVFPRSEADFEHVSELRELAPPEPAK